MSCQMTMETWRASYYVPIEQPITVNCPACWDASTLSSRDDVAVFLAQGLVCSECKIPFEKGAIWPPNLNERLAQKQYIGNQKRKAIA